MSLNHKKKRPTKHLQKELLFKQSNKCFYCQQEFYTFGVLRTGKVCRITPEFDHVKPWSKFFTNNANNFVASCASCNSSKNDTVYQSARAAKKGINPLGYRLHPKTK